MTLSQQILEYLRVLLSAPAVGGGIAAAFLLLFKKDIRDLLARIARIRFPGGSELFASQQEKEQEGLTENPKLPQVSQSSTAAALPGGVTLTEDQTKTVAAFIQSERANAALWEYRYLNLYLARTTQGVLDWLAGLQNGISENLLDSHLQTYVPDVNERSAIVGALQNHHLVSTGPLIHVTEKGREYLQWRGPLPPLPGAA